MNTIGDIDDAKLGRLIKKALSRIVGEHGGNITLSLTGSKGYTFQPGVEPATYQQHWNITSNRVTPGVYSPQQTVVAHEDPLVALERLIAATEP